jgi:hypothetical protein
MKYRVFQVLADAENSALSIYADIIHARAAEFDGLLDDWNNERTKTAVHGLPGDQINGDRFPLYGKNAATNEWETEHGHTKAWAVPVQINDGRWVFPSPDDVGVEAEENWWPVIGDNS